MVIRLGAILGLKDEGFTSGMKKSVSATDELKNKIDKSTGNMNKFENKVKTTGSATGGLTKNILKLAGGYISLKTATGLFGTALNQASNMEAFKNTLNVVMKDSKKASQTLAWAVDFANRTPFETDSIVEATVRLQAYGLTATQILPAIGDMASVMNKDIMQAVEAVADAQTGELERLKEFGITKQMIIDHANKIMKGKQIVNNKGQITDQKRFNDALFSLMSERFKGGMETQANSMKGLWSTVTGIFKSSLGQIMGITATGEIKIGGAFDKIKGKVKVLSDNLQKWSNDGTFEKIGNDFTSAMTGLGSAIGWVRDNSNWLISAVGGVVGALTALNVINTVNGLMAAWKASTFAQTLAQHGLNVALTANPIGLIVVGIGLAVAAGIALYKNWDKVKAKALELWEKIKEIWGKIKSFFANPIKGTVEVEQVTTNANGRGKATATGSRGGNRGNSRIGLATGVNRVPKDMDVTVHKNEAVVPAKLNPFNPGAKTYNNNSRTNNNPNIKIDINISGYEKDKKELANEVSEVILEKLLVIA